MKTGDAINAESDINTCEDYLNKKIGSKSRCIVYSLPAPFALCRRLSPHHYLSFDSLVEPNVRFSPVLRCVDLPHALISKRCR